MTPTFNSKNKRPWLTENHKRLSDWAIRIGKETIDWLINKGIPVSFANVAQWSKEVDTEVKGFTKIQYGQMKSCMNITSNIVKPLNREKITKELKQTT
ncbi:hypothetical protein LYSIN_01100 [Lysinibacillus sphaericus]|uniref:Uncharacterized protein n=1 Tax=Lysinibacillus sphaericus TaxID=1421 RepID=A0A2S5CZZ5_LYSSH|nr:hypothetical protein [Lysinibacillus sphaericus]POZ56317.1 hypothetical protein LYSIN_01100 [Lysinibacillus sphaericus]